MKGIIKGIAAAISGHPQGVSDTRRVSGVLFVVIMSLALAIAVQIYKRQEAKTEALQEEIAVEEERISVAKELVKQSREIAKKAAPYFRGKESLDDGALRRLASSNSIKITSVSQAEGELSDLLFSDLFNLEVAGGYHNLAKFVSSLESRGESLQIETLSLKNPGDIDDGNDDNEDLSLVMRIRVKYIKTQ